MPGLLDAKLTVSCPDCDKIWTVNPGKMNMIIHLFELHYKKVHGKIPKDIFSSYDINIYGKNPSKSSMNDIKAIKKAEDTIDASCRITPSFNVNVQKSELKTK